MVDQNDLMTISTEKRQDLRGRTRIFAKRVRDFVRKLPNSSVTQEYGRQLLRSSGSVAANCNEAFYAFSRPEFVYRIKITRKESNESLIWLELLEIGLQQPLEAERKQLIIEADELMSIFTSIAKKVDRVRTS